MLWQWDLLGCRTGPRDVGKSLGLLQETDLPHSPQKQKNLLHFFFLIEAKIAFGQNWKLREFGGYVFLRKNHICLGKSSLSFALKIVLELKAVFSVNKGKLLSQLFLGHLTLSQQKYLQYVA